MPTLSEQQIIEQAVIGKRVVAVAWVAGQRWPPLLSLESLTLEGGIVLKLRVDDHWYAVVIEIEETDYADA